MTDESLPLFPHEHLGRRRRPHIASCLQCRQVFKVRHGTTYCSSECYHASRLQSMEERFWQRVLKTETCWIWQGAVGTRGYGFLAGLYEGQYKTFLVHRYAYMLHVGAIADDLTIDHLCRNRRCVNPEHLEVVSRWENVRRGETITGNNSRKTHCKYGHVFDSENTYVNSTGGRHCKACLSRRDREAKARKRAKRLLAHGHDDPDPARAPCLT